MDRLIKFKEEVKDKNFRTDDPILKSLALIKHGKWEIAHNIAQEINTKWGSMVHGLLHRIEGDLWNASYWYRQAGERDFEGSIDDEWDYIALDYLSQK